MNAVAATWTIDEIDRPLRSILRPEPATEAQPVDSKKRKPENTSWPDLEWHRLIADILNALASFPEAYEAVKQALARRRGEPDDVRP